MPRIAYIIVLSLFLFTACAPKQAPSVNSSAVKQEEVSQKTAEPAQKQEEPPVEETQEPADISQGQQEGRNEGNDSLVVYNVPFTSQAPFAVWDDLHNEACEEASMIMVKSYIRGEGLSPHTAEQQILDLVRWEEEQGYAVDITSSQTAYILQSHLGVNAQVVSFVSIESMVDYLDQGNIIIVPVAGRLLGNPYFRQPGPLYHMLIVRGYDSASKEFITNDPGTKRGEMYRYSYDTLYHAIHDWPYEGRGKDEVTEEEMNQGKRVMVVVKK